MNIKIVLILLMSLTLINCSSGGDGDGSSTERSSSFLFGKCDHTEHTDVKQRQCREWTGSGFANFDLSVSCKAIDNSNFAEGFCPLGGLVGVCILNGGQGFETKFYYYQEDWDATMAEDSCNKKDLTDITDNTPSRWIPANEYKQ